MYCFVMSNKNSCVSLQTWGARPDCIHPAENCYEYSGKTGAMIPLWSNWYPLLLSAVRSCFCWWSTSWYSSHLQWESVAPQAQVVVGVFFPKSFDVLYALIFIMEAIDIEKNNKVVLIIHFSWSLFLCRIHLSKFALEAFIKILI